MRREERQGKWETMAKTFYFHEEFYRKQNTVPSSTNYLKDGRSLDRGP